ncbi:MAG TPA: hypothetical protein VEK08_11965 [Planctomycetota bacterium]|nr:hypothetical protein [Planctomycetota bacterium]
MSSIVQDEPLIIPAGIVDLASFRKWTLSESFPAFGKIDYIEGHIEVDINPANLWKHSGLKSDLAFEIQSLIRAANSGRVQPGPVPN